MLFYFLIVNNDIWQTSTNVKETVKELVNLEIISKESMLGGIETKKEEMKKFKNSLQNC